MLQLVSLDQGISKESFARVFPQLQSRLAACQRAARAASVPVIVVFEGWEAAGKGTAINRLAQSLDPRGFSVHSALPPVAADRHYPWMRRFWNATPAAGRIALFDRSWYGRVLGERIEGRVSGGESRRALDDIEQFERQLTDSGVVLVKFWLHIDKPEQTRRFRKLRSDPATAWRIGKAQRRQHKRYALWLAAAEAMLRRSDSDDAPWTVVAATDERYVHVRVFQTVVHAIESELARRAATTRDAPIVMPPVVDVDLGPSVLQSIEPPQEISKDAYGAELDALQVRLARLEHQLHMARVPAVILYEGWDAAGKGGNIRRLTEGLDPRGYEVIPIGPPTAEEKARHYLWRFWRSVPKAGHIALFDRSWYGRVLVERVEGFCTPEQWRRAYREINQFERQWTDYGAVLVKFWLHIDRDEQLRRFEARRDSVDKQWKITDEDWRNRKQWDAYESAVVEMLHRTGTGYAPWTILEANCKLHARLKALRTVATALEEALTARR